MQLDKCFSHQGVFAECLAQVGGERDIRNSCKFLLRNLKSARGNRSVHTCKGRQKRSVPRRFNESICIIIPARNILLEIVISCYLILPSLEFEQYYS